MSKHSTPNQNLNIQGIYDEDHRRDKILQPNRIFRVTHYFIDHWLPLLGPSHAWLVVALQQSYWKKNKGYITHAELGRTSGLKRHSIMNLLNKTEAYISPTDIQPTTSYHLRWFLRQIGRWGQGKQGKRANTYTILLNTPLTPAHQAGLAQRLSAIKRQHDSVEGQLDALEALLKIPRKQLLSDMAAVGTMNLPATPVSIGEIVLQSFQLADKHPMLKTFQSFSTRLTEHLLRPDDVYLGHQYFREKWIPVLGSNLSWLITFIRRHSYEHISGDETRNSFEYPRIEIAKRLGISERTLRRAILGKEKAQFMSFFKDLTLSGTTVTGQIFVKKDPLIPIDAVVLARKRAGNINLITDIGQKSTTGVAGVGQKSTTGADGAGQKSTTGTDGTGQKSTTVVAGVGQKSTTVATGVGQKSTTGTDDVGQKSTTVFKALNTSTTITKAQQQQKHDFDDDAVFYPGDLLTEIGIFEPMLSKLLAKPHVTTPFARAWRDWFIEQTDYGTGWVIRQMLSELYPPKKQSSRFALPENYLANLADSLSAKNPEENDATVSPLEKQWCQVLETFHPALAQNILNRFFENSHAMSISSYDDETTLLVAVGDLFTQMWLDERLHDKIEERWQQIHGQRVSIQFRGNQVMLPQNSTSTAKRESSKF